MGEVYAGWMEYIFFSFFFFTRFLAQSVTTLLLLPLVRRNDLQDQCVFHFSFLGVDMFSVLRPFSVLTNVSLDL